jgi:hypothetical protein
MLSTSFGNNPLAGRCLGVLDRLVPDSTPQAEELASVYFEPTMMDFSMWPMDSTDPLNAFGWPDLGHGI